MLYLETVAVIFGMLVLLITVERIYRRFAARHPELGPFRQPDKCMGCEAGKNCKDAADCATEKQ